MSPLLRVVKRIKRGFEKLKLQRRLGAVDSRLHGFKLPNLNSFLVRKQQGRLESISLRDYETRNESTSRLIELADARYVFPDFGWWLINTDDIDVGPIYQGLRVLSYCVANQEFERACPDFIFDHWRQTHLDDYESERKKLLVRASAAPQTDDLGWRGANTHQNRQVLVEEAQGSGFDVRFIEWRPGPDGKLVSDDFMTLHQQQQKWRYLIDIEGRGYSGRLKLLLSMGRVVFMQERIYQEWYAEHLQPWVHYVPVKSDFSNLKANLVRLKQTQGLEDRIITESIKFSEQYLSRDSALDRWNQLLGNA